MTRFLEKLQKCSAHSVLALVLLYAAGNFLLLVSRVVLWDGLYYYSLLKFHQYDALLHILQQQRLYVFYGLLRGLAETGNPLVFLKVIAFLSWLLAGIFIFYILRDFVLHSRRDAFCIALLYLLSPAFLVRFDFSVLQYTVANPLFFGGVWLYLVAHTKTKVGRVVGSLLALVLLGFSFSVNSFLVFYFAFLALLIFQDLKAKGFCLSRKMGSFVRSLSPEHYALLLFPFIFFIVQRLLVGETYGTAAQYNRFITFSFSSLSALVQDVWQYIVYGFFWPIIQPLSVLQRKIFAILFVVVVFPAYYLIKKQGEEASNISPQKYIAGGLILFAIAAFPYLMVGKSPVPFAGAFAMRHTLLTVLGSSCVLFGLTGLLLKQKWQTVALASITSLWIVYGIFNYIFIDIDSFKVASIVERLGAFDPQTLLSRTVVIEDRMSRFNWANREVLLQEYQGYIALINNGNLPEPPLTLSEYIRHGCPEESLTFIRIFSATQVEPTVGQWLKIQKNRFKNQVDQAAARESALGLKVESAVFEHGLPGYCSLTY